MEKMNAIKNFTIVCGLMLLALTACQSIFVPNPPEEPPTDEEYSYGQDAIIDSLDILLLESFPLQAKVKVVGFLPDGCTEIHDIHVERDGMSFIVTLMTKRPTGHVPCTLAIEPFEDALTLDIEGLPAGTYTVIAQDMEAEFTLDVDNVFLGQGDQKYLFGSLAVVEGMSIEIKGNIPVQVSVSLSGYLPDGCTKIHEIRTAREGKVFKIQIITKIPAGNVACTMALEPFAESVQLDVTGLPAGEYEVQCGGFQESFVLK